MNAIWDAMTNTPWWVYLILVYLIVIGLKGTRTQVVDLKTVFVMPIIFTILSVETLLTAVKPELYIVLVWLAALLLGTILGWLQVSFSSIKTDKEHLLVQVPGSWMTFVIILIIFASKYYFGYELAVDPQLAENTSFEIIMLAVSGLFTGLFIGRLCYFVYRFIKGPHSNLKALG